MENKEYTITYYDEVEGEYAYLTIKAISKEDASKAFKNDNPDLFFEIEEGEVIIKEDSPTIPLSEAFEFAEWISDNIYNHVIEGNWDRQFERKPFKTTSELYKLFTESKEI